MATPLQERLLTDASMDPALQALLGTNPFRWFFDSLEQGAAYPAVVVEQISGSKTYSATQRLATGFGRYQFTIWGGLYLAGANAREAVASAIADFLDQWSGGSGIAGLSLYSNRIVGERQSVWAQKDTPVYQKLLDVMIFSNDTL